MDVFHPIIITVLLTSVILSLSPSLSMSLLSLAGAILSLDVVVALPGLSLTSANHDGERLEAKSSSDGKNGRRSADGGPFPVPISLSPLPLPNSSPNPTNRRSPISLLEATPCFSDSDSDAVI
ncbi:hypothetical protein TIFTF001_006969 [Ficus carica]|uniref:Uncharacterized protein n=1 Tax=Ficus carica TaxID=3494 RepID=A0AA87ZIC3_FICCA|nr:hypothetical protein TIFTF001_006969 [Ficus carica]